MRTTCNHITLELADSRAFTFLLFLHLKSLSKLAA